MEPAHSKEVPSFHVLVLWALADAFFVCSCAIRTWFPSSCVFWIQQNEAILEQCATQLSWAVLT